MTAIQRVLVCGATGRQGGAVSRALLANGFEVLALTRSPQTAAAKELEQLGAQAVVGDLSQPVSLHPIMKGVDAVFSVQNYWERGVGAEGELRQAQNLLAAAEANGVRHVVQSIMARARTFDGITHFESKQRIAERLRLGTIPYTTLGTVWFMDNILDPKMGGSQTLTIAEVAIRGAQAEIDVEVPASEKRLAISVMHDENGNGKMDSNFLGIPLEGYATSNNVPHSMIGPPRFKAAEFEMRASAADVRIKMLY